MTNNKGERTQHIYHVSGMHCGGCANTVEQKLTALPGVDSVKVDLGKKQVEIISTSAFKLSDLQSTLENTSYNIAELYSDSSN